MGFPLLQAQFSISRALGYSIFFIPALLFVFYLLISALRGATTRWMLNEAALALAPYTPKTLRQAWDISLGLDLSFLQPVAVLELEFPEAPFKKMKLRLCRSLGIPTFRESKIKWELRAETRTPLLTELTYRLPTAQEEHPVFVQRGYRASKADAPAFTMDPLCVKLNSDVKLMAKLAVLLPADLDVLNGRQSSTIIMKFDDSPTALTDAASIVNSIASAGAGDAKLWGA